jgi:hypothetical protein
MRPFFPFAAGAGETSAAKYLREFSKKIETAVMVYSEAWGTLKDKNSNSGS